MLDWVVERTIEPEILEFINNINHIWSIDWGLIITQLLLMVSFGLCCYFAVYALGEKAVAKMVGLVTVVCCIRLVVCSIAG